MATTYDYTWDQGADLDISMIYKVGADVASATAIDLTNYSVRMDIRKDTIDGTRVYTFNSEDIAGDAAVDVAGATDNEAVLGADGSIKISVPRSLTLPPSGAVYTQMVSGSYKFYYDIMLRNKTTNKQVKILQGIITVAKSATLWV